MVIIKLLKNKNHIKKKSNNFFSENNISKTLHIRKASHLSFHLKSRGSSPYPAEALGIFPEAVRNGTIFY